MKRYWLALGLTAAGCFVPDDNVLFDADGGSGGAVSGGVSGSGSSSGAQSGTDSGQYISGAPGAGTGAVAGNAPTAGTGGGGGVGAVGGGGGTGGDAPPVPIESCDMVPGSVVSPLNGHCYRVNETELTFAEAEDACKRAAGHLVTVSSSRENDFTRDLHDGEHWLGASDQLADDVPGVGTYAWVTGEPWEYSDWEGGQPNAFETDCGEDEDGGGCYEHCGFQTDEGDWNDRSCWHTIVSICEWDVSAPGGEGGAAGAAGAGGGGEGGEAEPGPNRPKGPD